MRVNTGASPRPMTGTCADWPETKAVVCSLALSAENTGASCMSEDIETRGGGATTGIAACPATFGTGSPINKSPPEGFADFCGAAQQRAQTS